MTTNSLNGSEIITLKLSPGKTVVIRLYPLEQTEEAECVELTITSVVVGRRIGIHVKLPPFYTAL